MKRAGLSQTKSERFQRKARSESRRQKGKGKLKEHLWRRLSKNLERGGGWGGGRDSYAYHFAAGQSSKGENPSIQQKKVKVHKDSTKDRGKNREGLGRGGLKGALIALLRRQGGKGGR